VRVAPSDEKKCAFLGQEDEESPSSLKRRSSTLVGGGRALFLYHHKVFLSKRGLVFGRGRSDYILT